MLHVLDQIRINNQKRSETSTYRRSCQGSTVHGHFRNGNWIPEHDRCAHTRTYLKRR